jgi:O-antigen/teichoic acid export membrane protein
LVQTVIPLFFAVRLLKAYLHRNGGQTGIGFRAHLLPCFLNSNLSGYLKFAISPGDIFLLGLISSPAQVAVYGLAKQLSSPFSIMQTTVQTAITPEIVMLAAKKRLKQLSNMISHYVLSMAVIGGLLLVLALITAKLTFSSVFASQYSEALPIFYVLTIAGWLLLVNAAFRPLAITMDLLRWHNAALAVSVLLLFVLLVTKRLNPMTLAYVQLVEAALLRPAFSFAVWTRMRSVFERGHVR